MLKTTERFDPHALGLRAVEKVAPSDFDVLEYAAISSATLGEAIRVAIEYVRLMTDASDFRLDVEGDVAYWRFRMRDGVAFPRPAAEFVVALYLRLGNRIAGRQLEPTEVRFAHSATGDTAIYEQTLHCPVHFDAPETAIVFPAERLSTRLPGADAGLQAVLERVAREMLEKLPRSDSWTDRVRECIAKELQDGNPGLDHVASLLEQAPRTLRRRLKEEGTSHSQLLDELREDLAKRYLGEHMVSLTEIAYLLGFSEPSAFHRAFRRWTGKSATEFREQSRQQNH